MVCAVRLDYIKVSRTAGCDDVETMHLGELKREYAHSCYLALSAVILSLNTGLDQVDLQLPPQTRIETFELESLGMRKQSFENKANHAVLAASGTVEADA